MKLIYFFLSGFFGLAVLIRNILYDLKILKSVKFDLPVISVGNITVGGTGKTPHIEYLVRLLRPFCGVATLSRGYKRKTRGFRLVEISSKTEECGDEPLQLKQKFQDITVAVCENRVKGIDALLQQPNLPEVVLLDDAFQHRRIIPGINILIVDHSRPVRNDYLLPAGRLREGRIQVRRADIVIVSKCPGELSPMEQTLWKKNLNIRPYQEIFFTTLRYRELLKVFENSGSDKHFYMTGNTGVLIVTGIANPEHITEYLSGLTTIIDLVIFPDHHYFKPADVILILSKFEVLTAKEKIIVTTEKDAVRIREMKELPDKLKKSLYYLPVNIRFLDNGEKKFDQFIKSYVGKNKRIG